MSRPNTRLIYRVLITPMALAGLTAGTLLAQARLTLSQHADFSTTDRLFTTRTMTFVK